MDRQRGAKTNPPPAHRHQQQRGREDGVRRPENGSRRTRKRERQADLDTNVGPGSDRHGRKPRREHAEPASRGRYLHAYSRVTSTAQPLHRENTPPAGWPIIEAMKGTPLRHRLFALAAAGILPLAIMAAV